MNYFPLFSEIIGVCYCIVCDISYNRGMRGKQTTTREDKTMKATYTLQRKFEFETYWHTMAIDNGTPERLMAQANIDNDCHPGQYEYQIIN